ncbi:MAG: ATPase, T2SS/T4P/T4SS family [Vicinamibacterales bacterium]
MNYLNGCQDEHHHRRCGPRRIHDRAAPAMLDQPEDQPSTPRRSSNIICQTPDVIVIGEIRDSFSAEVAINAALTGHKVLTTFHTEDSIGGIVRLLNMNIEAFLISSTVVSVVAQRLVRRVCPTCAEDHVLTRRTSSRASLLARGSGGPDLQAGPRMSGLPPRGIGGAWPCSKSLVLNEL